MDEVRSSPLTLQGLSDKAANSPIPLIACRLADQQILLANDAASELFCLPSRELVGRRPSVLCESASGVRSTGAISALESGSVDSYRARRKIVAGDRTVDVLIWARTVQLGEVAAAVGVLILADEDTVASRLVDSYIGADPIDIALGGVEEDGRLGDDESRRQIRLGLGRQEIEGTDLASHALSESSADVGGRSDAERVADLERRILSIATELHALNVTVRDPVAPHHSRIDVLDSLAPRQREIVDRLLGGERVSTIAQAMFLSPSTVRNHLSKVFSVVGVGSQAELLSLLRSEVPDRDR